MAPSKTNILIIICDQLSAQALSAWGNTHSRTPAIDTVVQSGVRFSQAYTTCPLCQPARASLWTGRYPHQTGVLSNGRLHPVPEVDSSIATVGSLFSHAGYRTVHFGKRHDAGSLRGFEVFEQKAAAIDDASAAWPVHHDTENDRHTRKLAQRFLCDYRGIDPFLCVADLNNPHDICSWIGEFAGERAPIVPDGELPPLPDNLYRDEQEFAKLPLPVQYICCAHRRQAQIAQWDELKIRCYLAAYYHYLARVDREIESILSALDTRIDASNTLIVLLADHGDSMCGRWMATKHTSFYDETTRVPLVFTGPGINGSGRQVDGPVSLVDIVPTVCDYACIDTGGGMAGRSLMPWLTAASHELPHRYVMSQWHTEWGFTIEPGRMIRSPRYKYTHYLEGDGEELYDLERDPGELRNCAGDPGCLHVLQEHRALLQEYIGATDDPYFSLEWHADNRWRSHAPGYCSHRGVSAPDR